MLPVQFGPNSEQRTALEKYNIMHYTPRRSFVPSSSCVYLSETPRDACATGYYFSQDEMCIQFP
jgi:hypothetical protein